MKTIILVYIFIYIIKLSTTKKDKLNTNNLEEINNNLQKKHTIIDFVEITETAIQTEQM